MLKQIQKIVLRFFKVALIGLVALLILLNLFIIFSGKTYLYKGFKETYLVGKSGPGIYDSVVFENRVIRPAKMVEAWNNSLFDIDSSYLVQLEEINTTSFLVLHQNKIVAEYYWENHTAHTKSNSFSVAKSVVGLLVGIALDQGYITSFDEPIASYLDFIPAENSPTIRHLLAMTSDMKWRESGSNPLSENAAAYYGNNLNKMMQTIKFRGQHDQQFVYQSGNSQLLGMIVERATGQRISDFMEQQLWQKIGAENEAYWSLDKKDGMEKTFCCLYATTRDYARLGQLILTKGRWGDKQVISEETLREITSFGTTNKGKSRVNRYGLHYWLVDHPQYKVIYARGILGQYIISIPEKELVIVRTGHERKDKFDGSHQPFMKDHPKDLFLYLSIAEALLKDLD